MDDHFPNGDFLETMLNTSFDWNGIRQPFIVATENDYLNGIAMLFGHLLTRYRPDILGCPDLLEPRWRSTGYRCPAFRRRRGRHHPSHQFGRQPVLTQQDARERRQVLP